MVTLHISLVRLNFEWWLLVIVLLLLLQSSNILPYFCYVVPYDPKQRKAFSSMKRK